LWITRRRHAWRICRHQLSQTLAIPRESYTPQLGDVRSDEDPPENGLGRKTRPCMHGNRPVKGRPVHAREFIFIAAQIGIFLPVQSMVHRDGVVNGPGLTQARELHKSVVKWKKWIVARNASCSVTARGGCTWSRWWRAIESTSSHSVDSGQGWVKAATPNQSDVAMAMAQENLCAVSWRCKWAVTTRS
jgi:hypothetical protein